MSALLDNLNPAQREAVTHKDGPLLVVAGAGAGKTRVITHRIAHLVEQGVRADQILAVTFTNKAAAEMRERVTALLGSRLQVAGVSKTDPSSLIPHPSRLPFVATFHTLGVHILRESGRAIGIGRWFSILDRDESLSIVRKCEKALGFDPKHFEPRSILGAISREKGNLVSREEYESREAESYFGDVVAKVWRAYQAELTKAQLLDFDDLLGLTVKLLTEYEDVRKHYQTKWRYIHVDEYQDTNKVQYEMIRLLAAEHMNVAVVGDADQTIYTWRGATIENIMGFERDFPGATVVLLEENYRSTSNILEAANAIIAKNKNRREKKLFTRGDKGEKIVLYEAFDALDEAEFVVKAIKEHKCVPEQVAVLYRANFQSRILEEAFLRAGLPYSVLGTRFYERAEVRDVLSYVRAAMNQGDQASVARAAATPRRGLGEKTLEAYFASPSEALAKDGGKLRSFLKLLEEFKEKLLALPLPDALKYIVRASGLEEHLKKLKDEGQERLENVQELINLAGKYKGMPNEEAVSHLLSDSALASDQDSLLVAKEEKKKGVKLMTVHAAKGLEFKHVFVVGLEQGLFPHERMDDEGMTRERQEEERRLFYVAITRARERLYLSWAQTRQMYGQTLVQTASEYLSDIDAALLDLKASYTPTIDYSRPGHRLDHSVPEVRSRSKSGGLLPDVEELEY